MTPGSGKKQRRGRWSLYERKYIYRGIAGYGKIYPAAEDRRVQTGVQGIPGFHKDLERYEIYNGRKTLRELEEIIFARYSRFHDSGYLFECAFMQNIVEDLILFHQLSDQEILAFYERLCAVMSKEHFRLLYLYSDKVEENIRIIQKERSDEQGNQKWYPVMMEYLVNSPYGKAHGYQSFDDLISHLKHRQQVELRIVREIVGDRASILPAREDSPFLI